VENLIRNTLTKLDEFHGYIAWSIIFAFLHTLLSPKNRSVVAYFIATATCVPVGVLSGIIATEMGYSEGITYAIVSVAALLAQDVVKFILSVSGFITDKKDTIIQSIFTYLTEKVKSYTDSRFLKADRSKDEEDNSTGQR